jgi:amino acid transporter
MIAGINAPLVYLADVIVVLMLGSTLVQLSRLFPSAGGYFTYVSRTLGARAGFLTSWTYALYSALLPGVLFAYMGRMIEAALAQHGIHLSWEIIFALESATVAVVIYRGIEFSGRSLVLVGLAEIAIVVAFSLWGFVRPHDGHISLAPFNPNSISRSGFALAAVFGIFSYTGWESCAPLAEESREPARNIPIATIVSISFTCVLITICSWGILLSWGMGTVSAAATSTEMPPIIIARHIWGPLWWLVLLAIANSVLGAGIAFSIVSTRMWFAMARVGALPKSLGLIHARHQTPSNATWLQVALFFVSGFGGAAWVGIDNIYLVGGLVVVFSAILIYVAANIGLVLYMIRGRGGRFIWLTHLVFPVASSAMLLILFYKSLIPLPSIPILYAPIIVSTWIGLGILLLVVLRLWGQERWLLWAALAVGTGSEPPV